jgi:hypothetical protein
VRAACFQLRQVRSSERMVGGSKSNGSNVVADVILLLDFVFVLWIVPVCVCSPNERVR